MLSRCLRLAFTLDIKKKIQHTRELSTAKQLIAET